MQKKFGIAVITALPSKPILLASTPEMPSSNKLARSLKRISFAAGAGDRWARAPRHRICAA